MEHLTNKNLLLGFVTGHLLAALPLTANAQTLQDAQRLTDREQFEAATTAFRKLLAATPNDGATWYFLGENYWENEQPDSAQLCYRRGAELNPRYPLNHAGLGKVLFAHGIPDDASGGALQEAQARREEAKAKLNEAIALAEDKAAKHPKELKALTYREVADAYGAGPDPDVPTALTHVDKAIELNPNDADAQVLRGDLLVARGSFDASEAVAAYKRAAELMPSAARPVAKKALMYHRAKNYEAAIAEYDRAVAIDPSFAPAYSGRAEALFMTKAYDKATADYNKYLELNAGNISARVRYAKFLFLVGKYTESIAEIDAVRGTGVKDNNLRRIEGYARCEAGDFQAARTAMEAYFAEQPADKVISTDHEYMGKIYAGLAAKATPPAPGPTDASAVTVTGPDLDSLAAESYLKAARMDRTKAYLFSEAGKAFGKAKRFDLATRAFQEKIASGKPEVNDYYYLGSNAYKARMYTTSDSAWAVYTEKQPGLHQGYLGRARANVGLDPDKQTWQARPFYEEVVRHIKPEDQTKYKVDLEEAYFYLGFYHFSKEKDPGMAKCWFEQLKALNAGTSNTKQGTDMLLTKELQDVSAKDCTLPAQ
ncbi:MAG: tetratricopeptide repeat protein [Flavobacteriales bacterium]|nr:tetratricopeptide repeat protein [Flavobacteriales bacterium]